MKANLNYLFELAILILYVIQHLFIKKALIQVLTVLLLN
jgi:hypothetical protein